VRESIPLKRVISLVVISLFKKHNAIFLKNRFKSVVELTNPFGVSQQSIHNWRGDVRNLVKNELRVSKELSAN
jgi:hypothetical protein